MSVRQESLQSFTPELFATQRHSALLCIDSEDDLVSAWGSYKPIEEVKAIQT
jgi:hypothetical protein